jgi:protein phosphatase
MGEQSFTYESATLSHVGKVRELNEDRYYAEPTPKGGLWVVADGMGGYDAGEVASSLIVQRMATVGKPSSATDQHARVVDRLVRANEELQDYSQQRGGAMIGSTFVALLLYEGEYRCLWLGDSRLYLIRKGQLTQISKDHSEVREMVERGLMTPEEARKSPRRNVITRAVGVHSEIEVEVTYGRVETGDSYVLCSDGLTAHCSDADILEAVQGRKAQEAGQLLIDRTLERGATDNVTVVIVQCRDPEKTIPVDIIGAAPPK